MRWWLALIVAIVAVGCGRLHFDLLGGSGGDASMDGMGTGPDAALSLAQADYLKSSNTSMLEQFGYTVALDGDTLAVGGIEDPSGATGVDGNQADTSTPTAGAVYVFVRNGSTWTQQAYLKPSNTRSDDWFGIALAIHGDTIAVGADGDSSAATGVNGNEADTSEMYAGAVYVFTRTGTTWSQQAYVKASNPDGGDDVGVSVALGDDTLAVGAVNESSSATGIDGNQADNSAMLSGAAYVFARTGTTWSQQAYIKASNTQTNGSFGYTVALSSDGNTLAVGSPAENSNANGIDGNQMNSSAMSAGAVYVFTRAGTTWSQQAYVKASNTATNQGFGSVALSADGNRLVVGATGESSNAVGVDGNQTDTSLMNAGAAYVFDRVGTTWSQQAYLKASNTGFNDDFGRSVAIAGDRIAIGAYGESSDAIGVDGDQADNSDAAAGAVYLFVPGGTSWVQQSYLKPPNTRTVEWFGYDLALTADMLAVGAPEETSGSKGIGSDESDTSVTGAGAVFVYP